VHLSGQGLQPTAVVPSQHHLADLLASLGRMVNVTELFVFGSSSSDDSDDDDNSDDSVVRLTEELLAKHLLGHPVKQRALKVLMVWQFTKFPECLAGAIRQCEGLVRVTVTVPTSVTTSSTVAARGGRNKQNRKKTKRKMGRTKCPLPWAALDVLAMALGSLPRLETLQIRGARTHRDDDDCYHTNASSYHAHHRGRRQDEAVLSPEALDVLLSGCGCRTLTALYLENCGLLDDHMDVVCEHLTTASSSTSTTSTSRLRTLDVKDNQFTEDCLYTAGRMLSSPACSLHHLDVSGVISDDDDDDENGNEDAVRIHAAGRALAEGMERNRTLHTLEIEGTEDQYRDEFNIRPSRVGTTPWWQSVQRQLRINRAYAFASAAATAVDATVPTASNKERQLQLSNGTTTYGEQPKCTLQEHDRHDTLLKESPDAFVQALVSVSDDLDCLYYFLRTYSKQRCNQLQLPIEYHNRPHGGRGGGADGGGFVYHHGSER
jgi:hypothetical protein